MGQKKKLRRSVRTILEFVFAASATFLLLHSLAFAIPRLWGVETYAVTSGSMEPTISKGSIVFVDTNDRIPEAGKVITFHVSEDPGSMVVTHRVYKVDENGDCTTKGDANDAVDLNTIAPSQIIGTDVWTIRLLGYIAGNRAATVLPMVMMVLAGALLVMF